MDKVYYPFKVADEIIVLFWAGNETLTGLVLVVVSILLFSFTANINYFMLLLSILNMFISYLYFVILSCILVMKHDHILRFLCIFA